jgi:hypothetical protein
VYLKNQALLIKSFPKKVFELRLKDLIKTRKNKQEVLAG